MDRDRTRDDDSSPLAEAGEGLEPPGPPPAGSAGALPVDPSQLDALLGLVEELGAVESALDHLTEGLRARDDDAAFAREAQHVRRRLRRGLRALREGVLEARVVRLDRVFAPAVRLAQDVAAGREKRVRVLTRGGDLEVDRAIAEVVEEALIEIVSGAVEHGVETVREREAAGKSASATIELRAEAVGGRLRVSVVDDGRAVAAPSVPIVRGVVARIGGSVELVSRADVGAHVTLSVPLALVRVPVLVLELGGRPFALARDAVRSARAISAADVESHAGVERVEESGERLALCRLDELFRLGAPTDVGDFEQALVIESGPRKAVVLVDRIRGSEQVLVKPFGPSVAGVRPFAGAAELGTGELVLVIDPAALLDEIAAVADTSRVGDTP